MCNLSQGIKEDGIAIGFMEGEAKGRAEGEAKCAKMVLNMYNHGLTAEQIATYTGTNIDDVTAIIEGKKVVPV